MDARNVRVKDYIEELKDTTEQDAKIISSLFMFLSVNAAKLTSGALGYLVGGVQALKTPTSSNASIFQKLKKGAENGSSQWMNAVQKYESTTEVVVGIPGALLGTVGGLVHGTGKFFVNKCRSSRPTIKASNKYEEMDNEDELKYQPVPAKAGRYV